jgi:hypothetical protein
MKRIVILLAASALAQGCSESPIEPGVWELTMMGGDVPKTYNTLANWSCVRSSSAAGMSEGILEGATGSECTVVDAQSNDSSISSRATCENLPGQTISLKVLPHRDRRNFIAPIEVAAGGNDAPQRKATVIGRYLMNTTAVPCVPAAGG